MVGGSANLRARARRACAGARARVLCARARRPMVRASGGALGRVLPAAPKRRGGETLTKDLICAGGGELVCVHAHAMGDAHRGEERDEPKAEADGLELAHLCGGPALAAGAQAAGETGRGGGHGSEVVVPMRVVLSWPARMTVSWGAMTVATPCREGAAPGEETDVAG